MQDKFDNKPKRYLNETFYNQRTTRSDHPDEEILQRAKDAGGYCGGISVQAISNFFQGKSYPLETLEGAKEAAYAQFDYMKGGDPYPRKKILNSGGKIAKHSTTDLHYNKEQIPELISKEFKECQNISHENNALCAKFLNLGIKLSGNTERYGHALSLTVDGETCGYGDPNAPQYNGPCNEVIKSATKSFLSRYGNNQKLELGLLDTQTFIKKREEKEEKPASPKGQNIMSLLSNTFFAKQGSVSDKEETTNPIMENLSSNWS